MAQRGLWYFGLAAIAAAVMAEWACTPDAGPAMTGGTGGAATGAGSGGTGAPAGSGGAAITGSGGAMQTSGCGTASWPPGDQAATLDVGGTAREFIVSLPTGYDGTRPQKLVFAWHGRTGLAQQIAGGRSGGFYGVKSRMTETIFVAPQGLGTDADPADTGWPNTGGRDIAFLRAMIAYLSASYCIDQTRIFSVGMSYGGMMSHTIGCQMSDVFRAIAPIAGAMIGGGRGGATCLAQPIAAWITHGSADTTVTFASGETARNRILTLNHCGTTTTPVPPASCVAYDGCDAGYPVTWCPHPDAHIVPSFTGEGVAGFFNQF
jgi:poly(3-hydroxybutyrate) depolymerase